MCAKPNQAMLWCWAAHLAILIIPLQGLAQEIGAARHKPWLFHAAGDECVSMNASIALQGEPIFEEPPWSSLPSQSTGQESDESLISRVTDPTAWLMQFRYRQLWNWPVDSGDANTQVAEFRPTIPFKAWGHVNLLRVTVPYDLEGANDSGLGDVQIYDLIVFDESWGRWGIGPSIRLLPDSETNDDTFQFGPAAGAVAKSKHWTAGVLTLNYLSENASQTRIQPILAYKFDDRWAVSIGESEFRYEWKDARWSQLPLGVQIERICDIGGQKFQIFINPQYNFQCDSSNSGWTLFLGFTLLVPNA